MTTVIELARDILASIATDTNAAGVAKWIDNRYKELVSQVRFRHLRKVGELTLPAPVTNGTIAATRDSTTITGISTTFTSSVGSGDQEYFYFRSNSTWYKIESIESDTSLTLSSPFSEDSTTSSSYTIVKRHHPLASDARWTGDFFHSRLSHQLELISLEELNSYAPRRPLTSSTPFYVSQIGTNSSGLLLYEIYPTPATTELINYIYWTLPTTLLLSTTIPQVIDPYVLKEGVLIDLYRYEKSRAIRAGNIEEAMVWRNDEKAQDGVWKKAIKDAIRTSRGADDISLILDMFHGSSSRTTYDQRTARDYIYDNWR